MSGINVPLLRKALEHIDAHPEEHDQRSWMRQTSCGTTMCLAATVAVLAGHEIDWSKSLMTTGDLAHFYAVVDGRTVPEAAQDSLGADDEQAYSLFYGCKNADDLWAAAEEMTDGEIRRLP